MTKLPEVVMYDVLSGRPAASISGRLFYATDTNTLSRDNGSSWDDLVLGSVGTGGAHINVSDFEYLPSPGTDGDVYLTSNGVALYRSDGISQHPWGPLFPFTQPDNSLFAWRNQGSATVDTTHGGIFLMAPPASSFNLRIREMTLPTAPYTVEAAFYSSPGHYFSSFGLALIESGSGKIECIEDSDYAKSVHRLASVTSSTSYVGFDAGAAQRGGIIWHRVSDNGIGNRTWDYSWDGQHWFRLFQTSSTDFITPDKIGFYDNSYNANLSSGVTLLSWKQT